MNNTLLQLIKRIINTTECNGFYWLDDVHRFWSDDGYDSLCLGYANDNLANQLIVAIVDARNCEDVITGIESKYADNTVVVYSEAHINGFYNCKTPNGTCNVKFFGKIFEHDKSVCDDSKFNVLAIVHFYNEEDVIQKTTEYLLNQKIDVYLLDNWSTDSSYTIAKKMVVENPGHVFLERFPQNEKNDYYDWYHQLKRTEEISQEYDYDWYIHYDADEMRVGPWKGVNLRDTLRYIDWLGYNLVENTVIDFKITDVDSPSIFMTDGQFDFGRRATHFEQTKTWKKTDCIDLKTTGGHNAIVDNPRVFPLKILNRHYPLRTIEQAKKKIFMDRLPRFEKEQQERGWHKHYDSIEHDYDLISSRDNLITWDENTINDYYVQFFTGCGILDEEGNEMNIDMSDIPEGSPIAVYGAGSIGKILVKGLSNKCSIVHWVDGNYVRMPKMLCKKVENPEILKTDKDSYEYIIVATTKVQTYEEIMAILIQWGIDEERIIWKTKW